ncbi:MAG: T9SS type A sorting domain-containing protein, partial [Bacteroidota bacterium]
SIVTLNLTIITSCPATVNDSFCNGKGYTLPDGSVVFSAGTYVVQIPSVSGCDSIITINLTVNPTYNIQQQVFICPGGTYVLPTGQTINNSGIYVSHLFTTLGCDSIITSEVRFYPAVSVSITANPWACGEGYALNAVASGGTSPFAYLWSNGQTGNYIKNLTAGTYTVTVTDANGCTAKSTRALSTPVPFRTQTQGGWGSDPTGSNVGTYLANNFLAIFPAPAYLTVGCSRRLQLTSAAAVNAFLPSSGTSKALPAGTTINPGAGLKNTFAGQVVALTLNVAFDLYDPNFGRANYPLRDLRIASGTFAGWTVQQVLNESNLKLGGCNSPYTFSQLNDVCTMINQNFDNGLYNGGGLICVPATPAPVRIMPTEATEIQVYPNPNSGSFTTEFEVTQATEVELVLTDLSGKVLRIIRRNVEPGLYQDTELSNGLDLTPGIYLVRFRDGDKPATTTKVVVTR